METTIDGKEIKLVTRNDISKFVSWKVSEMLARGFVLYFILGSQGEEGKVAFTSDGGKTVYVFWIYKGYESIEYESIHVTGKKYSDVYEGKTLWKNEGETFLEKKWYKIERTKEERYVETIEDIKTITSIQRERRNTAYDLEDLSKFIKLSSRANKIALKIIKNKKGYKSVFLKDIDHITRRMKDKYCTSSFYTFYFTEESGKKSCTFKLEQYHN